MSYDLQDSIPDDSECQQCGRHDMEEVSMCACGDVKCGATVCRPKFGCRASVECESCDNVMLPHHAARRNGEPYCAGCAENYRFVKRKLRRELAAA